MIYFKKHFIFKLSISSIAIIFGQSNSFSQKSINFNEHIAPIIHQNCSPCHREGEAGPFTLINYKEVKSRAKFIQKVTETKYMPPWKAEHGFGEFQNERGLNNEQISLIKNWVISGMKEGPKKKFIAPNFNTNSQLGQPDLTLTVSDKFRIPQNNKEEFYMFSLPTNLTENKKIKAIEFRPGNKKLVHHARISIDSSQIMRITNAKSIDDPSIGAFSNVQMKEDYWYGWVPGTNPIVYPKGTAKVLKANSDLLFNIHYAPNAKEEFDQSAINIFYEKDEIEHEIKTAIIAENYIQNKPFYIKPDTIITFFSRTEPLSYPIHIVSVQPHMHQIGKKLRAYCITPDGDLLPLIKINDWDFNFQQTFQFKEIIDVPIGSVIYFEGTFDNTASNPLNPNRPSKPISYGWKTTEEMMDLIIQYY
jgi:Copper type II ascorbate-dependent monooxygenase, C-terminal domain